MDIFVDRNPSTDDGTKGTLTVPQINFTCDTLELPWRDNQGGVSCIMPDTYKCWTWHSPTFNRTVLRLEDKHGRTNVLVHSGNFGGDTTKGEYSDILGCTEVGRGYGTLKAPNGKMQFAILNSSVTLNDLISAIGEGNHTITYRWKGN